MVGHNEHNQIGVLLKTKLPITDDIPDLKEHFGMRYRPSLDGGRNIIDIEEIEFYKFKVIEVISSEEVVEHLNFTHAYFKNNCYQMLYISEDRSTLLERCKNYELFLYSRENMSHYAETKEIKWNIVRRIVNRSTDLCEFSYLNYLHSPDLKLFIDSDDSGDKFIIRKTLD
jgi:hypothetical protein